MTQKESTTTSSLDALKTPRLTILILGFVYLSSFLMLACVGFSQWQWLLLDLIAVLAIYEHEGVLKLPYRDALERISPKGMWLHISLCLLTIGIVIGFSLWSPEPSYAFFRNAETVLKACFKDATLAISLFFATLRFLLVAYIGAQMVFAIYQISRGESPLPLLMPALAVALAVGIGSMITSLVLTGTTCTALSTGLVFALLL